jgi:DNA modification methylase
MKPFYQRDGITIYCGDSLELVDELRGGADLLLSDPPYGIGFDTDYTRFVNARSVCPGKTYPPVHGDGVAFDPSPWLDFPKVALFGANCFFNRLPAGRLIVWDKRFASGKAFRADAEIAWMKGGYGIYIYAETAQGFVRKEPAQHPTQKPVGLMRFCIEKARPKKGILDPYMGSGSTLVAAHQLGIPAVGIEIEARYCEIAAQRLEQSASRKAA